MGHHQGVTAYPAARNAGGSRFWGRDFRIRAVDGVTDVHHVHAWSLTSGMNVFSSHVCVRDWSEGERVLSEVSRLLRDRYNIYFSTTQIEERCLDSEEGAEDRKSKRLNSRH